MVLSGFQKLSHQSSLCGEEPCSFEPSGLEPATPHESLSRQSTAEYDPGYSARVDFALKLGYTEDLVQTALNKLGPNPSHNELLAELIKLGAQVPTSFIQDNEQDCMPYPQAKLRPVVIDGSNVAMSHGNKELFSCIGIKICVDWFRARGHKEITVFVPKWRKESCRPDNLIKNQEVLSELEKDRILVYTPSRLIGGKRLVCYDDRFILRLAADTDGIVVSNDNYRDLCLESPDFRKVVEDRILMYSFVNDRFMPPEDPLGRSGPSLDKFLTIDYKQNSTGAPCPYGRKCTYGSKCKFNHPERGPWPHKTVTERLMEHAQKQMSEKRQVNKTLSCPAVPNQYQHQEQQVTVHPQKTLLSRTRSYAPDSHPEAHGSYSNLSQNSDQGAPLHQRLQRQLSLNPYEEVPQGAPPHQHIASQNSSHNGGSSNGLNGYLNGHGFHNGHNAPNGSYNGMTRNPYEEQKERMRLHYHLASLFPEDQVVAAMQAHPGETSAHVLCATILAMFPPSR
ncbi:hypothetical protein M8J76_003325 [Diaphorina citri]|nr:hypothetical protein M8J76_003325 [Diaphorina citri]